MSSRVAALCSLLLVTLVLAQAVRGGPWQVGTAVGTGAGEDPDLVATAFDPYDHELLRAYARLRDALAAGDSAALLELAHGSDSYAAYLAAVELAAWDGLPAADRLGAVSRQLELRVADPLKRAEARQLELRRAQLAEAAGLTPTALDAYRAALPLREAVEGVQRTQPDPYRRSAIYQQAGLHRDALSALAGLGAPSIEAPSLRALGRYQEALDAYRRWLAEIPSSSEAALGEAWCLYYLGELDQAQAAFANLGPEGYYGLALIASRSGDVDRAVELLGLTGRADLIWLATGLLEARDRFTASLPLYLRLARGNSAYADDAAYRAHVLATRLGRAEVAAEAAALLPAGNFFALLLGAPVALPEPPGSGPPGSRLQAPSEVAPVSALLAAPAADQLPAALAAAAIGLGTESGFGAATLAPDASSSQASGEAAARFPSRGRHALALASTLYSINEHEAAVGELLFALRASEAEGNTADVLDIAEMLQSMGEYRQSSRAARELLAGGMNELRVWYLAYPPAWPETVISAAASEGVEPALVWAVMRQESAFFPQAISTANAQGLMQVIPSTWTWIAELMSESPRDPFDIQANIAYGAHYLAWLMRYFGGDLELVVASYNGGQGYVRRLFQADFVAGDKNEFYREIDRSETREYLQRVVENLAVYRALYPSLSGAPASILNARSNSSSM